MKEEETHAVTQHEEHSDRSALIPDDMWSKEPMICFQKTGEVLRSMRKDIRLTQEKLGRRLGVGNIYVYQLEKGDTLPSKTYVGSLINVYMTTAEGPVEAKRCRLNHFIASLERLYYGKNLSKLNQKVDRFFRDLYLP